MGKLIHLLMSLENIQVHDIDGYTKQIENFELVGQGKKDLSKCGTKNAKCAYRVTSENTIPLWRVKKLKFRSSLLPCFFHFALRCLLLSIIYRRSFVKRAIRHYPKVQEMLQYASECAVCGQSFLNTWLECVHFVDAHKVRHNFRSSVLAVNVHCQCIVLLCSEVQR